MIISNLGMVNSSETKLTFATVSWEDRDLPDQELVFEISGSTPEWPQGVDGPSADAFLAACFPLAAVHGETRVRIEGQPCPMLVEGLYTTHAWWTSWGGMPFPVPRTRPRGATLSSPGGIGRQPLRLLSHAAHYGRPGVSRPHPSN